MIGDPSGRSAERNLLDRETLAVNVAGIRGQLERFLDFSAGSHGAVMVNNLDWLGELSLIEFLRDTGKHFTVPYMLAKDSVQVRLERGLSFTEFSYMLLQSYDFAHLYRTMGVELQMGGADQWGNITAGLELIRRTSRPGRRRRAGPRPRLQAAADAVGHEVRQERSRRFGLARPGANVALRVLPVLAQHRRPRHRDVPALVHGVPARADRGARERRRARTRGPAGATGAGARHHGPDARRRGRGSGGRRLRGEVLERGDRRSGRPSLAVRVGRWVPVRAGGACRPGRRPCWPTAASSRRRARRAA